MSEEAHLNALIATPDAEHSAGLQEALEPYCRTSLIVYDPPQPAVEHLKHNDYQALILACTGRCLGMSFLEMVFSVRPFLPVVVVGDEDDDALALQAVQMGAEDYLIKRHINGPMLQRVVRYAVERRNARSALRTSMQRFQQLFDNMPGGIWIIDCQPAGCRLSDINTAACRLENVKRSDVLGQTIDDSFPAYAEAGVCRRLSSAIRSGKHEVIDPLPLNVEGETRWVQGRVFPLTHGVAAFAYEDVTARFSAEMQLARAEQSLRQAQRMEAVGRLAGGIAHDFNNMLAIIQGYVDIMQLSLKRTDKLHDPVVRIKDASKRAASLTQQLLAYGRRQVMRPKTLSLNERVQHLLKILRRALGEDITLIDEFDPQTWSVHADPALLDQVLMNLATNARDAMPTGGQLRIETGNRVLSDEEAALRPNVQPGEYAFVRLSDTGDGMSRETLDCIFDPFFTTKCQGKGEGLGLATVYGTVRQSGGFVEVTSEVGQGSSFLVCLPRHQDATVGRQERTTSHRPIYERGSGTVLVVEDETALRQVIRETLSMVGYDVLDAGSPKESWERLREHGKGIDLLITDVIMPEQSGPEFADAFVKEYPTTPILFISGHASDTLSRHGLSSRRAHFLAKPFRLSQLAEKIRAILQKETQPAE